MRDDQRGQAQGTTPVPPRASTNTSADASSPASPVPLASGVFDAVAQLIDSVRNTEAARFSATEHAQAEHEREAAAALRERDADIAEAERVFAARAAQIDTEAAATLDASSKRRAARAEREHADHTARLAAIEERADDALARARASAKETAWLAETVYDGAAPKVKAACEQALAEARSGRSALDEILALAEARTAAAVRRLRTRGPSATNTAEHSRAPDDPAGATGAAALAHHTHAARAAHDACERDAIVRAVRSGLPALAVPVLAAGAGLGTAAATGWTSWPIPAGVGAGVTLAGAVALVPLIRAARTRQARALAHVRGAIDAGRAAAERAEREAAAQRDARFVQLRAQRDTEIAQARDALAAFEASTREDRARQAFALRQEHADALRAIEERAAASAAETARMADEHRAGARTRRDAALADARARFASRTDAAARARDEALAHANTDFDHALRTARALDDAIRHALNPAAPADNTPSASPRAVRLGSLHVSHGLGSFAPSGGTVLPLTLDPPVRGSLLVRTDSSAGARDHGLAALRVAMLALLQQLPPGRVRFTIFDPVGLGQSFAGFMRLADETPELVGGRIWTEPRHIEQKLTDLTEHMETVIQKYLRDEHATLEAYNEQAGEIAEPYRFLVIADLPEGFTDEAARRLASIAESGPRCGVHVLALTTAIVGSLTTPLRNSTDQTATVDLERLAASAVVLHADTNGLRVSDARLAHDTLRLDTLPDEPALGQLLTELGARAKRASRVEVAFHALLPDAGQEWTRSSAEGLRIPLGRVGATRIQELRLGVGTSQHALIAGKTGSGKSTLLHVLIAAAAAWYAPGEVEFYLVDFKKGVEFKAYADGSVPHVRAVAIESDREFGLSVLRRLDDELKHRGDAFRAFGAQGLAAFRRERPSEPMPRQVLIIDEFQEFFTEDDRVAQEAALLLDRLVRQGRAFGIHVLLGSQTLSGAYTLARSTMGQMAVRIALQCSETDSYLILSEDNAAARLLSRPGEAIYNDANGLIEGNSPFQTAWLPDAQRDAVLERIAGVARTRTAAASEPPHAPPIVFEGHAAAELARSPAFRAALAPTTGTATPAGAPPAVPIAWVGEPVAIRPTTGMPLRRRSGSNLLIVGQQDELALGMLSCSVLGLALQTACTARAAEILLIDPTPEDDALSRVLPAAAAALSPISARLFTWRDADAAVTRAAAALDERTSTNQTEAHPIVLVLAGLHRLRSLRKKEDDFSFSSLSADDVKAERADQLLRRVLQDGPGVGVFTLCWCDNAANLQRALDRSSIGEFGARVLMQTSASDSSMLIESGSAARLGLRRAIYFDEQRGDEEKFRPFEPPSADDLRRVHDALTAAAGAHRAP